MNYPPFYLLQLLLYIVMSCDELLQKGLKTENASLEYRIFSVVNNKAVYIIQRTSGTYFNVVSKSPKKSLRRFPKRDGEDGPKTVRTAGCRCPPRERLERSPSLSAVETPGHGNGEDGTLQSEVLVACWVRFSRSPAKN